MYKSSDFPIENRPGLEDASTSTLFKHLLQYGDMSTIYGSPMNSEIASKREMFVRMLSDWHLISFVGTLELLSEASAS